MITHSGTFRKAIGLSIAVHIVIFGSAVAFAYYHDILYLQNLRSMTVSLVGSGSIAGTGKRPAKGSLEGHTERVLSSAIRDHMPAVENEPGISEQLPAHMGDPAGTVDGKGNESGPVGESEDSIATGYTSEEWTRFSSALERVKIYPRLARERGIEGKVLVRFKVLPTGEIEKVNIVKSSGVKILDDASVSTVYRAVPAPYVDGWVEVPVLYKLERSEER